MSLVSRFVVRGITISPVPKPIHIASRFRAIMAFALMLWCAGAGCVLVSYAHAAAMNGGETTIAEPAAEQSGMMTSHGSCHVAHAHKHHKSAKIESPKTTNLEQLSLPAQSQSDSMSCCPLANGSIVTTSRSQTSYDTSIAAADTATPLAFANSDAAPLAVPLRLPNQHHLYLRGCVFLI